MCDRRRLFLRGWEFYSYQMCRSELIQQQQYETKIRRMQCWIHCICYYSGKCMNQYIWKRKQQSNKRTRVNYLETGCGLPSEARRSKNTSGLNSCFLNKWGQIRERGRKRPTKTRARLRMLTRRNGKKYIYNNSPCNRQWILSWNRTLELPQIAQKTFERKKIRHASLA